MPAYIITYDKVQDRDYDALIAQLRAWHCVSPAESVWLGVLAGPAPLIRDLLINNCMDQNDRLTVIEIKAGADWATWNAKDGAGGWLSTFVSPSDNPPLQPLLSGGFASPRRYLRDFY